MIRMLGRKKKGAKGNGRNVIERFSLPEAFFEGTLQRGVPLWRTARMFEQELMNGSATNR
jgi:hypothetical protein